MSQRQAESVPNYAKLVEDYTTKYPKTERKALKNLILSRHPQVNPRSLNRHLKKAFDSQQPSGAEDRILRKVLAVSPEEMNCLLLTIREAKHERLYGSASRAFDIVLHSYVRFPATQREVARKILVSAAQRILDNRQKEPDFHLRQGMELKIKRNCVSSLLQILELPAEE